MGNPFKEQIPDLLVLDTYDITDKDVVNTVNSIETLGKSQFQEFLHSRIKAKQTSIFELIKRNKLPLFSFVKTKKSAKHQSQVAMLKKNCQLFSQLYVACHFRDGNLDEFFSHENQTFPPSLSKDGMLHTGYKSDLLCSLDDIQDTSQDKPSVKCIVIDGTAVANILAPVNCINFKDYSKKVSPPFILQQFQSGCRRVDIVWDVYLENSLKESARIKGGQGVRRRVLQDSTIPSNWHAFHLVDQNGIIELYKIELFKFLAVKTSQLQTDGLVIATHEKSVLSNQNIDQSILAPCHQEETDTPLFLHAFDASDAGIEKIMIRKVDTDVVPIGKIQFS